MSRLRIFACWFAFALIVCGRAAAAGIQFAPVTAAERHQKLLELQAPGVVMLVSPEPGMEDQSLMALLHFRYGVKLIVVQISNGEGTPGDTLAAWPAILAGERREEATRAAESLNADTWFANMPDPGAPPNAAVLAQVWPVDTVATRIATAIRIYRPDEIIVTRDARTDSRPSARDSVIRVAAHVAIGLAASSDTSFSAQPGWTTGRLAFAFPAESIPPEYRWVHPVSRKTASELARPLLNSYRTLSSLIPRWSAMPRAYSLITADNHVVPVAASDVATGILKIPPRLMGVQRAIQKAVNTGKGGVLRARLKEISAAIDSTERVLRLYQQVFTPLERRLTVTWKNGLEDYRCSLLGVKATIAQSESLITENQVWFLDLKGLSPQPKLGTTEIIFPLAMKLEWTVNETLTFHFDVTGPARYTVLSPGGLQQSIPASMAGMRQHVLRTRFPYFIAHRDPDRAKNFVVRGEAVFRTGPRRTFEMLTSLVFAAPSVPVISVMQNFSRDPFHGMLSLRDTSHLGMAKRVGFAAKDEARRDTFLLPYRERQRAGDYPWSLELSGKGGVRTIEARGVDCAIDSGFDIGYLSFIHDSPIENWLRGLGYTWHRIVPSSPGKERLVIIDRNSLGSLNTQELSGLAQWVRDGGKVIMFPQEENPRVAIDSLFGARFVPIRPIPPSMPVTMYDPVMAKSPNLLVESDWTGWVMSRGLDRVEPGPGHPNAEIVLEAGGQPVVESVSLGHGMSVFVAVDLWSQLINIHGGACRFFANLVHSQAAVR